jgi:superfamily II DNA or RNA helicase
MSGWTEETLRAAASWKAFKEGKALFESGAVAEAQTGAQGWRGAVRSGNRLIRLSVTAKSATDIEARCPCPENRSSGMLCGHAIAVGLATLARKGAATPANTHAGPATPRAEPATVRNPRAFALSFPPNWREALARGKLTASLSPIPGEQPAPADHRLAEWLEQQRVADKAPVHLQLDGTRADSFLLAAAGHPRVTLMPQATPLEILTGQRIALAETSLNGETLTLVPDPQAGNWHPVGSAYWRVSENLLCRSGEGTPPESFRTILDALAAGKPTEMPVSRLLAEIDPWQQWLQFPSSGWLDSLHFIHATVSFQLALDGNSDAISAQLSACYPGSPAVPPNRGQVSGLPRLSGERCEIRNLAAETAAVRSLESFGFQSKSPGTWILKGESAIFNFLAHHLPTLRKLWQVTDAPRFHSLTQQLVAISPRLEIISSGEDWLCFNLSFQTTAGETIPAAEVQRILRSGTQPKPKSGGRRLMIADEYTQFIEPLFQELDLHQQDGHYRASKGSAEVIHQIREKFDESLNINHSLSLEEVQDPPGLRAELRPYQRQGTRWMLDRLHHHGGALLADDMGLGKTIQTISLIEHLFLKDMSDSATVLVVATASLLGNWQAEFARFAPARKVRVLHGSARDSERARITAGDVVLTTFGTLTRDLAWHLRQHYRLVAVDEASLMRNPDTDHAKALCKLQASFRIALTGTPVENGVRDLWSLFRFIQPGWLGSREDFRDRYELPLASGEVPAPLIERLKLKTRPFLLRRTKEQVAPELPSKWIIDEFCDLSPDQQSVYRGLLEEARRQVDLAADSGNPGAARMRMLTALLRLRQTCNDLALLGNDRFKQLPIARRSAKIERLIELLDSAVSGDHKVLIFSQFQKQLLEIEQCVVERGWACLRLDGQTRNRQKLVDEFQSAGGPPFFLISLKAGGYGLNLTAADTVIHVDPWWNPAAEAQATDRAHRIGQARPVTVYRLLTRGTVEEKVLRLQAGKRELSTAIDEAGGGDAPQWTKDDLESLIRG